MTLYFRRFKIRNPLQPRAPTYFEGLLAAEAKKKKTAQKATEEQEKYLCANRARRKQPAGVWQRAADWLRALYHRKSLKANTEERGSTLIWEDGETVVLGEVDWWESDYTAVLADDE